MPALKRSYLLLLAATGVFALSACNAQEPAKSAAHAESSVLTKPVATVNGVAIPESRMDAVIKDALAQGQHDSPELRAKIKDSLINQEIIIQEALKQGIDKTPEFKTKMDFARQQILLNTYVRDYVAAHPVSDEDMKKEFEQINANRGDKEYKVRHILVKDEKEARDIIAQLGKKGASFAKIAAAKSEDPGSKKNGGQLDWAPAGNYVKPFADAIASLKKGETTHDPVQTQFGWHVIQVEDVRPLKPLSFEEVKPNLQQGMQNQLIQKMLAGLRAAAKVE